MRDRRVALGVAIGLVAGGAMVVSGGALEPATAPREVRTILSDCDGALRELAIHYVPGAAPIVATAYREFLGALPDDVTVRVICPDRPAFDDLLRRIGDVRCRAEPVFTGHAMTAWSRDRWLALAGVDGRITLLTPAEEDGAALWPARAGDAQVGEDIARELPRGFRHERSALHYDGGDFVASGRGARTVFVTPRVFLRNVQRTVATREVLVELLERATGKRVVVLDGAPDHHAGMFLISAGGGRVVVGDPSLAKAMLEEGAPDLTPCGDDWSAETQLRFDAVAARCREAGYEVARVPVVPGKDGRTYVTYTNVILDERDGARVCYMPVYRHAPPLNNAAERQWRSLGYDVRRVDCTRAYTNFGSLRCLVNVLRRDGSRG
ncbi:MAG: hypothetical protein ACYS9X_19305 [Planctomycetota bacterium]|jgi:hypothetical protein